MKEWEYALKSLKKRIVNPDLLKAVTTILSAQSIIRMNNLTDEQLKYGEKIFSGEEFFKLSKEEQDKDYVMGFHKLLL